MSNYTLCKELVRLYKAAKEERQRIAILHALARLDVWGTIPIQQALDDECPAVRAEAARLLGGIYDWRPSYSLLQMLQQDEAPVCRAAAAETLGKLYAPFVPEDPPMGYDNQWTRYFRKEVPTQLVYALLNDESYRVRAAAARALGYLGDKENAWYLCQALKDEDYEVRASAAEALGALKVFPYIGEVSRLMHDPHPKVRHAAEKAVQMLESY